jgi:hypothetical protein
MRVGNRLEALDLSVLDQPKQNASESEWVETYRTGKDDS